VGAGFGGAILAGIVALIASLFVLGWGKLQEAPCPGSYSRCEVHVFYPKLPKTAPTPPVTISPLPPERPRYAPVSEPRPTGLKRRRASRVPVG
jgi:hypothetical protein